jgi:hypothetical protein
MNKEKMSSQFQSSQRAFGPRTTFLILGLHEETPDNKEGVTPEQLIHIVVKAGLGQSSRVCTLLYPNRTGECHVVSRHCSLCFTYYSYSLLLFT